MAHSKWLDQLRRTFDEAFGFDWEGHIATLNARFRLTGEDAFSVHVPGLPPVWFNSDVEAIEPGRWALVVSLNPHTPPPGFYGTHHTPDAYWTLWRTHNRDVFWYPTFYRPLVRVAAAAVGEAVPKERESDFATTRMVFTEIIPYASERFALRPEVVAELARTDPGVRIAAGINRLLIEGARPAVVLVNGKPAIADFAAVYGRGLRWEEERYPSAHRPEKPLWHRQGTFDPGGGPVPVAGFPFLRKPATHNANVEIDQLGRSIRAFIELQGTSRT